MIRIRSLLARLVFTYPFQGALTPLNIRDYRFLLTSNFLWWQARWMEIIINGWLVLELTNSVWQVALIGFYRSIPLLLVGTFSGFLIDRIGWRKCIQIAQAFNLAIYLAVALLIWYELIVFWHLAVASTLVGAIWSLEWPARRSLIPDLISKERIVDAMLMETFAQNISSIAGPFLSGVFIKILGAFGGYLLLTATSALGLLPLLFLTQQRLPRAALPKRVPAFRQIYAGLSYLRHSQTRMGVVLITLIMNYLAFPHLDLLPVFARDILNQDAVGLGVLGAANGIGSFFGILMVNRIRNRLPRSWIFAGGSCYFAFFLIAFALSNNFALSLTLLIAGGLGRVCFSIMQSSIMLLSTSDEMRSRAMGSLTLFIGAGPFGRLQIGALAGAFGAPAALVMHGLLAALGVALVVIALPEFRQQNNDSTS
ncbi:MFS transporter [Chloroflexi bacterium TSY]|nr:MFS transporter [Chloroflexi bacterium TSY]